MDEIDLVNEFAHVTIKIDREANGVRLVIESKRFESKIYLDPLMLDFLTLLDQKELRNIIKDIIEKKYQNLLMVSE
ncbi:hypothetical protein [Saccharolobus shibatae]|uniref:Uncharacterized protein n=1 Tax=Saccharolobus shibatae TaxID=2286 RepID=A0A8F5C1I0_9CREN|nr:hypothetical protein [Saccharolobus shibatae]QXJ35449.1 hypothetical protein J5U22_01996 [Saccharolobus shibatae]